MLDGIILYRFRDGAGSKHVTTGNYELYQTNKKVGVLTATSHLVPGTTIRMAIIVGTVWVDISVATAKASQIICPSHQDSL